VWAGGRLEVWAAAHVGSGKLKHKCRELLPALQRHGTAALPPINQVELGWRVRQQPAQRRRHSVASGGEREGTPDVLRYEEVACHVIRWRMGVRRRRVRECRAVAFRSPRSRLHRLRRMVGGEEEGEGHGW
jgi:hypothetical protein